MKPLRIRYVAGTDCDDGCAVILCSLRTRELSCKRFRNLCSVVLFEEESKVLNAVLRMLASRVESQRANVIVTKCSESETESSGASEKVEAASTRYLY